MILAIGSRVRCFQSVFMCPFPFLRLTADLFDVVMIVGALSGGHVPVAVVRDLCKCTKPGENIYTR